MESSRKTSIVWSFFQATDSGLVQCTLCKSYLFNRGSTSNMLKHLRLKHPQEISRKTSGLTAEDMLDSDAEQTCSVNGENSSDMSSIINEAAVTSILAPSHEVSAETTALTMTSDGGSAGRTRNKRSLIWEYFKRPDRSGTACCTICKRELQCSESGSTGNLRRHILKRHPKVFAKLTSNGRNQTASEPKQELDVKSELENCSDTEQVEFPEAAVVTQDESVACYLPVMETSRKRSVVWRFFEAVEPDSVQCTLCRSYLLKRVHRSTTNMLKHLRQKHPEKVTQRTGVRTVGDIDADGEHICSVEVSLEDDGSDNISSLNEAAVNSILVPLHENPSEIVEQTGMSDGCSAGRTRNKRSLIWEYFEPLVGLDAARCNICKRKLQCSESGSTSNLRRHMLKRHPKVFSALISNVRQQRGSRSKLGSESKKELEKFSDTEQVEFPVEVSLDDEASGDINPLNEADVNSILGPLQEDPSDFMEQTEMSDEGATGRTRNKRSLIWEYFQRLHGLDAARCSLCTRKLQCCESGGTSNLWRHLLKRHPNVFAKLTSNGRHQAGSNQQQELESNKGLEKKFYDAEQIKPSDPLRVSRAFEGEKRVLMQERELIESLRRTQKEEARTLEQQRELMERLRASDAREAAAEREKIELLRKVQQEEAEDLCRQREELEKEKAELQRKWEELQHERDDFLLLSK